MKILLAAGGTGGHINPAIAIAQYFKKRDKNCEILFVGTPNGMEAKLVQEEGFKFIPIEVMGFWRGFLPSDIGHNIKAVVALMGALKAAKRIINEFEPSIVIGTGGYVSMPIVYTASKMKVRTAIHEQNAFPGATTRFLSNKVDVVLSAVIEAKSRMKTTKHFAVVGNPIRESIIMKSKEQARLELGIDDKPFVFSFGGSLGADAINKLAADLIEWNIQEHRITYVHGYGRLGKEKFPNLLKSANIDITNNQDIKAYEYIDNMDSYLAAADLIICRAGAITISEIQATGKVSVLIPSPNVTANHQYHNAMVLKNKNACVLIEEKNYDKQELIKTVEELCFDKEKITEISRNAQSLAVLDSTKKIYDNIMKIVN